MATESVFHPYRVVQQTSRVLQLEPGINPKTSLLILRFFPGVLLLVGAIIAFVNKNILYLFLLGGMALVELIVFRFIKIPSSLQMDDFGFTLHTVSLNGARKQDFLWNDVEHLSHHTYRTKSGRTVSYSAHLIDGKKVTFLSFGNSVQSDEDMAAINEILREISNKEVRKG